MFRHWYTCFAVHARRRYVWLPCHISQPQTGTDIQPCPNAAANIFLALGQPSRALFPTMACFQRERS